MMLLRSSILALLIVLPAVLAKKKKKNRKPNKNNKAIQEVYVLIDDDTPSLSLEVDFFAILGFLRMAILNTEWDLDWDLDWMMHMTSFMNNNVSNFNDFTIKDPIFEKPDIIDELLQIVQIDNEQHVEMMDKPSPDNTLLSNPSLLFNIGGTQLISTGSAHRIFDAEEITKYIPAGAVILDPMGEPVDSSDVMGLLSDVFMDEEKKQREREWESNVSDEDNHFSDACTVIDGKIDFINSKMMNIKKQKCDIDVCIGTYDYRGDPNCFNLRFSGKRYVDIDFNPKGHTGISLNNLDFTNNTGFIPIQQLANNTSTWPPPEAPTGLTPKENLNSFTASLVGGTGRFAMAQGQARVLITKEEDQSLDNVLVLIEYIRFHD